MAELRLKNACTQDQWGSLCWQMVAVWDVGKRNGDLRSHLEQKIGEIACAAEIFGPCTDAVLLKAFSGALDDDAKTGTVSGEEIKKKKPSPPLPHLLRPLSLRGFLTQGVH